MRIALAKEATIILLMMLISTTVILIASPSLILRDANIQKDQLTPKVNTDINGKQKRRENLR